MMGGRIFAIVRVGVFLRGILAASITERRAETATLYANKKIEITGINAKNEEWGLNYPREYDTWRKTMNMDFSRKHLGNMTEDVVEIRS